MSAFGRQIARALVLLAAAAGSVCPAEQDRPVANPSPGGPVVEWVQGDAGPEKAIVRVSGLSADVLSRIGGHELTQEAWRKVLRVVAEQGGALDDIGLPSMLGTYSVVSETVQFTPLYPLEVGVRYRAIFRPWELPGEEGGERSSVMATFEVPRRAQAPTTSVTRVYPTADLLPENLLKFYIHFSAPMSMGDVYRHIRLLNDAGEEIEAPFLEIDEELWNPTRDRLTLFIDPGRIKRGVRPLEEVGPVFEEGHAYVLGIDPEWQDAHGLPLKAPFEKRFKIGPPDREPLDPHRWTIMPPPAGGREALAMEFPGPVDHALALRMIRVVGPDGTPVAGETSLDKEECRWRFTPARNWVAGAHAVTVQTTIEDLAGNNIGKPFEVDTFEGARRWTDGTVRLGFDVR